MIAARRAYVVLIAIASLVFTGCQTTRKPEPVATVPVVVGDFEPVNPFAPVRNDSGRYPNLLAQSSYALWITNGVAAGKLQVEQKSGAPIDDTLQADAQRVGENYYVIEVNTESAFPDGSIAFDVVGLRTIDAYLTLSDGSRVWPVQRVLGTSAREEQIGTIRQFGRTNILVFPKKDVLSGEPTIPPGTTGLRLTLDGFNSIFSFEWAGAPPDSPSVVPAESTAGLKWSMLYGKLRELARMTQ